MTAALDIGAAGRSTHDAYAAAATWLRSKGGPGVFRAAALAYAERGLPVFPLAPLAPLRGDETADQLERRKKAAKRPLGRLAPNGFKDATTDAATIDRWWRSEPRAGVGLAIPVGLLVLDVDPRHGGDGTLAELEQRHGALPCTPEVMTGSVGRHVWFRAPTGENLAQRSVGAGVDVRVGGLGYVVAPPTIHGSGRAYRWANSVDIPIVPAPAWVVDRLRRDRRDEPEDLERGAIRLEGLNGEPKGDAYGRRALESAALRLVQAPRGTRNNTLASEAYTVGQLVGAGRLDESNAREALRGAVAGWDAAAKRQTMATLERQFARGVEHPREPRESRREFALPAPANSQDGGEVGCDATEAVDGSRGGARSALRIADVLATWRTEGPLVHEPTGLAKLDELTGGGPVFGSRWYLLGAPDAGKTALLVQLADIFARRGIVVGILAVDEEPSDIVTRLAQRAGWKRIDCEEREEQLVEAMADELAMLPIKLYDDAWTIEAAAGDLASTAAELGARACLVVDSIQAVRCDASAGAESLRESVTANVKALRTVATRFRLIALATSEMNRGAYRSIDAAERANDMAAAKESGAVEYSARVMLVMRSVKDERDKVDAKVVKNKHGPGGEFCLAIDRRRMTLEECDSPDEEGGAAAAEQEQRAAHGRRIEEAKTALVRELLRAKHPPTNRKDLVTMARRASPARNDVLEPAVSELLAEGTIAGGRGAAYRVTSAGDEVSSEVSEATAPIAPHRSPSLPIAPGEW